MVATKQQAIALALVSALTLAAGIAVMVLFSALFSTVTDYLGQDSLPVLGYFWPYGVPVLITGVLGMVAAAIRNNVGVGIFMATCIVCLVIEAVFVVVFALVLVVLTGIRTAECSEESGVCSCTDSLLAGNTFNPKLRYNIDECMDPNTKIVALTKAGCAMVIVSWVLMLAGAILSCMACCCGKRGQSTGGTVVMASGGQPAHQYEMNVGHMQASPGQPYQVKY